MEKLGTTPRYRVGSSTGWLPIIFAWLVILVCSSILSTFYFANDNICIRIYGFRDVYEGIEEVLNKLESLQEKLEFTVHRAEKNEEHGSNISMLECQKFLKEEVIRPLYSAHDALRKIHFPRIKETETDNDLKEDPLVNAFGVEEIQKYITPKGNRDGESNVYGTEKTYNTIGHACVAMKRELEEYMEYNIGSYCRDDWNLGQMLMLHGCDPLPRRRCLARARPWTWAHSTNGSLQLRIPKGRNVCLKNCSKENFRWIAADTSSLPIDFLIKDVLSLKPGEIRIGLDFSIGGTGTFAARMKEQDITIVSMALNLGADPFNEMIALRGLIPLYLTLNQRLPFFDNTMDLIHSTGLVDGWIDLQLLDYILFDWDRVLRPGGFLWIDRFLCRKKDLDEYMYMFLQFGYRKHKWAVARKGKHAVFLSALLEKPGRS